MYQSNKTKLDVEANIRDGNKCKDCGITKGLETHHIIPGIEELSNLITLCHACHKKRHGYSGCFKKGHVMVFNRWLGEWEPQAHRVCKLCGKKHHAKGFCKNHYMEIVYSRKAETP